MQKDNGNFEFHVGKITIEFFPQSEKEQPERVAKGEIWEKVTFAPTNHTGKFHNMLLGTFDFQLRREAWEAGVRTLFSNYTIGKHMSDVLHPDRLSGMVGWVSRNLLGDAQVVRDGNTTYLNAFTRQPETKLRIYGLVYPWGRLIQVSEGLYQVRQDNTFEKSTGVPNGSLLHQYIDDLAMGATIISYPLIEKRWNNDGAPWDDTNRQDQAKWLFATLSDIEAGKLTLDDARRHYYGNKLFFKATTAVAASEESQAEAKADAVVYVTGGEVAKRNLMVKVDGKKMDVTEVPSANYTVQIEGRKVLLSTLLVHGRSRLLDMAKKHNGSLELVSAN